MTGRWSLDQVAAFSPDEANLARARGLASRSRWKAFAGDDRALWGVHGRYRSSIDRRGPAFRCSCPSRKHPCKHSLALALLDAAQPLPAAAPPEWVRDWIEARDKRSQMQQVRQQKASAPVDPEVAARRAADAQRRREARIHKTDAGVSELSERLRELVRRGIASHDQQDDWDEVAARMVDAQARGLAAQVQALRSARYSGEGWPARMLERMGLLHLLLRGYAHRERLPPALAAAVKRRIGFAPDKTALLSQPGVRDRWWIVGQQVEENDEGLRSRRCWLWGRQHRRWALLLDFVPAGQSFATLPAVGGCFDAELVFYPGPSTSRALLKQEHGSIGARVPLPESAYTDIDTAYHARAEALAADPWLQRFPVALEGVVPELAPRQSDTESGVFAQSEPHPDARLRDVEDHGCRLSADSDRWSLLALSAGKPLRLMAELRQDEMVVLSFAAEDGVLEALPTAKAVAG